MRGVTPRAPRLRAQQVEAGPVGQAGGSGQRWFGDVPHFGAPLPLPSAGDAHGHFLDAFVVALRFVRVRGRHRQGVEQEPDFA